MPSTDGRVDLRSDTVTTPTPEMRIAMARAPVGDDVYREDPTVNRLEALAAELLGKEAALYMPTGTLANQLAIHVLPRPGTEMLCPARAHVYRYEPAAVASNSGVQIRPLPDENGVVSPHAIAAALEGSPSPLPGDLAGVDREHAHARERPARAGERDRGPRVGRGRARRCRCTATARASSTRRSRSARRCTRSPPRTDTVMFCLSKGLGAPVGSLLCGRTAVIDEARAQRAAPRRRDGARPG